MANWYANLLHVNISNNKVQKIFSQEILRAHQPEKSDISDNHDRQHENCSGGCSQH